MLCQFLLYVLQASDLKALLCFPLPVVDFRFEDSGTSFEVIALGSL
jgi:hypothetical protein